MAPAYLVYLLRNYCFPKAPENASFKELHAHFSIRRFSKLGCTVLGVFIVSFGPFVAMSQIGNVLSRLFPFKRGLSHAYWAPNFWALYNTADKVATVAGKVVVNLCDPVLNLYSCMIQIKMYCAF